MAESMLANAGIFEMVVYTCPIRQLFFCHLGALDEARVVFATKTIRSRGKERQKNSSVLCEISLLKPTFLTFRK
jgi:hypothetical protein